MKTFQRILMILAAVLAAVLVAGQPSMAAQPSEPPSEPPSEQDNTYLVAAHQANLAEIAAGTLAAQKGASQDVKDLGTRFAEDHTRLDQALTAAAQQLDVTLPTEPNDDQKAVAEQLNSASTDAFDSLWVMTQLAAHEKSMQATEKEQTSGSDSSVKSLADTAAPVIQAHHQALTSLAPSMGVPSPSNS